LVQSIESRHILVGDVKAKNIPILRYPLWIVALGQRHPVLLQTISDQDLRGRLVIFLRELEQSRVVGLVVPDQRALRLDDDLVLLAILDNLPLLTPGMQLYFSQPALFTKRARSDV
jgi:hypothetical protein